MKNIILHTVINGCVTGICCAGNDNYPLGARSAGMAATSVMMTDIWASTNNQAGLAYLEQPAAALYCESRFHVKSLSQQAGVFAVPVKSTTIAVNYRYFGFSKYNESKFGLAVGKKLGEKFALGVQVDYFHTHFAEDYGNFGVLCGEAGLLCEPVKNLTVGAHLFNISRSRQKASPDERVPVIMRFGLGYTIRDKATISVETEKDSRMDAVFKGGLEYNPIGELFLRCGVSTGHSYQYAFGLGYSWKSFTIDAAFSHHKVLGYNPHISLIAKL
ncbi:MAG: hypothetical protein LBL24_11205 [Bacteroidales bacterium]|nr:hypothetical protein [Bacteroidales bacterium]